MRPPFALLLTGFLVACARGGPAPPPPDPAPVVARVLATLKEAARLDRDHRTSEADSAWRRAHAVFERDLEPALARLEPDRELTETEYLFARIRAEIDQARGAPGPVIRQLGERLEDEIAALPEETPAS